MALFRFTALAVRLFAPIANVVAPLKLRILAITALWIVLVLPPDKVKTS